MMVRRRIGLALACAILSGGDASAEDPKIAPGRDPGGVAVAILTNGFDYLRPELAAVLARDGEGEAIAWDAVDGDHRPFGPASTGTDAALAAAASGGVRVVTVRVAMADATSIAKGVGFAASTPARVVVAALDEPAGNLIEVMTAAAQRFDGMLLVVSVPQTMADVARAGGALANLVLIDAKQKPHAAADAVAAVLGCGRGALSGASGAELKRSFEARLEETASAPCKPGGETKSD